MPKAPRPVAKPAKKTASRRRARSAAAQARGTVEDRLLAAMERLLEGGQSFRSLSVEQLANEAGIARATFYLHYRDRGALVRALTQRLTGEIIESAGSWFRDGTLVDRGTMHLALHGIVRTFKKHHAILCALADSTSSDPELAALHEAMVEELVAMSRRAIAQVRRAGQAAPGAPVELPELLTTFVEVYCTRHLGRYDARRLGKLVDALAFVCGNAIFANPD